MLAGLRCPELPGYAFIRRQNSSGLKPLIDHEVLSQNALHIDYCEVVPRHSVDA